MKKLTLLVITIATMLMAVGFVLLSSFTIARVYSDEVLKQLGISKADADSRIINSMLDGSLNEGGLNKAKNIALGNRAGVTRDLLVYVKKKVSSTAFIQEYTALRERKKPSLMTTKTPEEFHKDQIAESKKAVIDAEAAAKKNTLPALQATYEKNDPGGPKAG
jgi:hypothetical protein